MKNEKCGVVIVTYNRFELLKLCVEHAIKQIRPYDAIYVIDNASTDATQEYLENLQEIVYKRLPENTGGAGGFYAGVKTAYEDGCDWITVIDDDAILDKSYLKNLLDWQGENTDVLALCGKVTTEGIICNHFARKVILDQDNHVFYECPIQTSKYKEPFECNLVSFCGLTVNRKIIDNIGFPDKRFFINYDDTEYSARINKYSKIYMIPDAVIDHRTRLEGRIPEWKVYYGIRNQIYMLKKHYGIRVTINKTICYLKGKHQYVNDNDYVRNRKKMINNALLDAWIGRLGKREKFLPGA